MPVGSQHFSYSADSEFFNEMESADIRSGMVKVELDVKNDGNAYTLDFTFKGSIVIGCDRCLDDMDLPVDTVYHIVVKYGEEYNDNSDDLLIIPESDNYLNVAYLVYDTIALTIPLKHVHPKGFCNKEMEAKLRSHTAHLADEDGDEGEAFPGDDADIEIETTNDPRWEALRNLLDNK